MASTDSPVSHPQCIGETKPPFYVHGFTQKSQYLQTPPFFNYHPGYDFNSHGNVPRTNRDKYFAPYFVKCQSLYIQNHKFIVFPTSPINDIYKHFCTIIDLLPGNTYGWSAVKYSVLIWTVQTQTNFSHWTSK